MKDATLEDFQDIGASPRGSSEKRRAFLILKSTLNTDSTESDWERAQRILYHIKKHIPEEVVKKDFAGFTEFLAKVNEVIPPDLDEAEIDEVKEAVIRKKELTEYEKIMEDEEKKAEEGKPPDWEVFKMES